MLVSPSCGFLYIEFIGSPSKLQMHYNSFGKLKTG